MKLAARRWRIFCLLLWTLAGLGGCAGSQSATPPKPDQASATGAKAPATASRGLFYEVRGDNATVFLLGSVHVGKRQFYPLDAPIESAFAKADTLVLEIDLTDKEKVGKQVAEAAVYPPGDRLEKHVDAEVLTRLREYAGQNRVSFESLSRLRPWTIAVMVIAIEFKKAGFEAEHGIDMHFAERARGKQIVGIETAEEQVSFFTSMDESTQNQMLKQVLEEVDAHAKIIDAAALAWLAGDEERLDRELLEPVRKPEYRELYDRLFTQRNLTMTRAIEGLLKRKGTHFVVVGAGHVIGKQGIVDLLRSKGYTIERR
jgi:uncharacterized protein